MSDDSSKLVRHIADATNIGAKVVERVLLAFAVRAYFGGTPLPRELTAQILNMTPEAVDAGSVLAHASELQHCLEELMRELGIREDERADARHELQRAAFLHNAYTCDSLRGYLDAYNFRIDTTPAEAIRDHGITALRTLLDDAMQPDDL